MTDEINPNQPPPVKRGFSAMQVLGIVAVSTCIAVIATGFALKMLLFPAPFKPVVLKPVEEQQLAAKLKSFEAGGHVPPPKQKEYNDKGVLIPEKYSEESGSRQISFTERELNAMLAKNTDLADTLAIDLAEDMISVKLLIPLDSDFPMLGGKTLKVKAGAELAYRNGKPVVKIVGVSLMGVPMPNAWLGGMKNIDLVEEFGGSGGGWETFADGVDSISVVEGHLNIRLKE
ncbi:MAG: arginine N-succinyltransferase [Desulforhopalus sp.]